ncbi:MAG: hypothetical protein VXW32_13710 [Myxococcota bacterium]|nr:hypothetical protein [Myxococcota bacterium]
MRNFAIGAALLCCFGSLFLLTSWALVPQLGDSLIQPIAGLLLMISVVPLFVAAAAIGKAEEMQGELQRLEQQLRMVAAQIPPPGVHTPHPGMPQLSELVSRQNSAPPQA